MVYLRVSSFIGQIVLVFLLFVCLLVGLCALDTSFGFIGDSSRKEQVKSNGLH